MAVAILRNAKGILRDFLNNTARVPGITRTLLLYRLLQLASLPFVVVYLFLRLIVRRGYGARFAERLGFLPHAFGFNNPNSIWLHAVSVGEVLSAVPLIKHIRRQEPGVPIYLSVGTMAGRRVAERDAEGLVSGIFYAPLDYASCVRRTLRAIRPALLIVLETEIWPNMYAEARLAGARLAMVNARISTRAWKRYCRLCWFFAPVLQLADVVYVQSDADAERYRKLGASPEKLHTEANLKYDAALPGITADIPTFGAEEVWIAASTVGPNERGSIRKHDVDEDDIVLDVFRALSPKHPNLLLILAPRQLARFDVVAEKLKRRGLPFIRRSRMQPRETPAMSLPGVLLLDTLGELSSAFRHANVVFVGGSLAPRGGHNIIEPAAAGVPIVVGPSMQNFEGITRDFLAAHALVQIESASELLGTIDGLLDGHARARTLGEFARCVVDMRRGVTQRLMPVLLELYFRGQSQKTHNAFAEAGLRTLAGLWSFGGEQKRRSGLRHAISQPPLPVPVVSIGGITVGGSGKTPFTTYLAAQLRRRGYRPAILTRGYRRRSPAQNVVLSPGAKVPASLTGDEAQIFLRAGVGPIGIGSDRYETAKVLLDRFPQTDLFLLDDGFQHARLRRNVDVVVIDGLDPFGGGELVPLGRLREPLRSLERASVFVVTRAESDIRFQAIRSRLRELNAEAPVFRTRLVARTWRDAETGQALHIDNQRVAAFCGLGNPQNFWNTLESLGLNLVFRWSFNDHHTYRQAELRYLASQAILHGAEVLVTTEKDRMNLPGHPGKSIAPLRLAWLEIDLELDDSPAFFRFLDNQSPRAELCV